jgi:hypothetical protein
LLASIALLRFTGQDQHKAIAVSKGINYHRTVTSVLTGCLTSRAHPTVPFLLHRRELDAGYHIRLTHSRTEYVLAPREICMTDLPPPILSPASKSRLAKVPPESGLPRCGRDDEPGMLR